mmetsp:Transcript_11054/g.31042  ORF Transcript_11054/g.31042 Transcript_11054/m.31042 type:complete len:328 (+) Transcript_11054:102-1085(+)
MQRGREVTQSYSTMAMAHDQQREHLQRLPRNAQVEEHYMRQALDVARAALGVGEVPVGCVIVLRDPDEEGGRKSNKSEDGTSCSSSAGGVVVSHGANQVNATRDATRHAELVAIDRMLTGGLSSDRQRLPPRMLAQSAHGRIPADNPLLQEAGSGADAPSPSSGVDVASACINGWNDAWINVPDVKDHWKNGYGWGSGRLYDTDIFKRCDLYVTCEPCIMCAAALARVGIGRVFFGCHNNKFGGCGSLMSLHDEATVPRGVAAGEYHGYPIVEGILKDEAVRLLRSFYDRENFHAPDDKRRRKPPLIAEDLDTGTSQEEKGSGKDTK